MKLDKYSFGTGDRFAHQGLAQLEATLKAEKEGVTLTHVWNKSHREHKTVKTSPSEVRQEADNAVKALGWKGTYLVDADHINLSNVDLFIDSSNFFTIDVADYIGKAADDDKIKAFVEKNKKYVGDLNIPGIDAPFKITEPFIEDVAKKFLYAAEEAANIYNHIADKKGEDNFIAEVSMDEVDDPQTPPEMFFILSALAHYNVKLQTVAPKFTGRFNKGTDYVGDLSQFAKEFEEDVLVIKLAIKEFGLPDNLKLSVHSGSDKFSIYKPIREAIKKHDAGVHVKTAGTTWLEEIIGLAEAGGDALDLAKDVYIQAYDRFEELAAPYATVIDIKKEQLPTPGEVKGWDSDKYVRTLRHNQSDENYNLQFRQLIHVGYKVAAEMGDKYLDALKANKEIIAKNVTYNIYDRHMKPLFIG